MRLGAPILFLFLVTASQGCLPEETERAEFLGLTAASVNGARDRSYSAVRRYTDYVGTMPGEHTERFVQADRDHFRVDLLTLGGVSRAEMSSQDDLREFDRIQALFQGGRGRYIARDRDFRLRDLDLFEQNYSYVVYDSPVLIAGRVADIAEVTPNFGDRPSYTVWIDRETLVTLKYLEFLSNGALAAEMEVLSFDTDPELGSIQFNVPPVTEPTELGDGPPQSFVSFQVLSPMYLPRGFVRRSVRVSQLAGVDVLAWTYSDGLLDLYMHEYAEQGNGSSGVSLPTKVGLTASGPNTEAHFAVIGTEVHVGAKLDAEEVMIFIEGLDLLAEQE